MAEDDGSSPSVGIQKAPLQCTMFMSKGYVEKEIKFSYLVWNVKDYSSMETDLRYRKKLEIAQWILMLVKTEEDISLTIACNQNVDRIVCYVSPNWDDDAMFSTPYEAEKIGHKKYSLKIARSAVKNPETNLEPDVLGFYFRYNMEENYWRNPLPRRGVHEDEKEEFASEMVGLLETGRYSDFTLVAADKAFKVHKIILASRSEIFKEHFRKIGENGDDVHPMKFDVAPESMDFLLRYVYSGKIDFKRLSQDHVSEVLMLANRLGMELLELRCLSYLRFVCYLKVNEIRSRARGKGIRDLSEKAEEFLNYVIEY